MVYVYGDSHAHQFQGHDDIKVFSTNSISIHDLTKEANSHVKEERPAVLVFGEIDVRCLISPQIEEKGREEPEVLIDLIRRYSKFVHSLKGRIILCSITPASDLVKDGMDGYPGWQPGFWKRRGSLESRIKWTKYLNRYQWEIAEYLDIHDYYADTDGSLRSDVTQDGVHICPTKNAYMVEKLREVV